MTTSEARSDQATHPGTTLKFHSVKKLPAKSDYTRFELRFIGGDGEQIVKNMHYGGVLVACAKPGDTRPLRFGIFGKVLEAIRDEAFRIYGDKWRSNCTERGSREHRELYLEVEKSLIEQGLLDGASNDHP